MQYANIKWINNIPYSIDFNDIYFSTEDGLLETEYVFIEQNQLKKRFSALKNSHFIVIETGFGTGLNFLAAAGCWLKHAPADAQLYYISTEKFPLTFADLARTHALWPKFAAISSELLQQYSSLKAGNNVFNMAGDRIQINLLIDDILQALSKISQKADAWFLDGFSPAKNSEMWSAEVFGHLTRLSQQNTTFATFTSASTVRRSLQAAGFTVKKHPGFGKKREMLSGIVLSNRCVGESR